MKFFKVFVFSFLLFSCQYLKNPVIPKPLPTQTPVPTVSPTPEPLPTLKHPSSVKVGETATVEIINEPYQYNIKLVADSKFELGTMGKHPDGGFILKFKLNTPGKPANHYLRRFCVLTTPPWCFEMEVLP
jgi:hypothetical protein